MALLLSLCNPKKPFVWTVECQHASEGAKSLLLSSPELAFTAAAHTLYSMCLAEWNRWNSISDMLVLLRNPILSSSLTSLHACSPPTPPPNSVSIYFFHLDCLSLFFNSILTQFLRCQLICCSFCIHFTLIYNVCQIKCHECWHIDINPVRIFHSTRMCCIFIHDCGS